MSIVDENGQPIAYQWNDEAAIEKVEANQRLRLVSDEEFCRRFPKIAGDKTRARKPAAALKTSA